MYSTKPLCLFHVPAQAGIPVFDEVANASNIQQWAEKLQQWQQTVQHYQSQMNAYKQQLATATGIRDVQAFLNQAKNLTADIKNLKNRGISLNDLLTGSGGSYAGELNRLYDKYKLFDNCPENASEAYRDSCKQMLLNQAVSVEDTSDIQEKISDTLSDISNLASRIENAKDSKESQDLANVVSARSIQLNALTTQWEMSVKQSEMRNQLLAEQRRKAQAEQMRTAPIADLN
ncbi:type IV secretion system protein [Escherichia coli]|uniref:type IV secretion system protein n=1 Tax=Escherichia coli TaxID=562 RepID=UPI002A10A52F|nr:type IV secretion system protein VirB5 [Escherichia coli]